MSNKNKKNKIDSKDMPLFVASVISGYAQQILNDEQVFEKLSPTTQELVKFWFSEDSVHSRDINFHIGQKEAILNIVYLSEVLKIKQFKEIFHHLSFTKKGYENWIRNRCENEHIEEDKLQQKLQEFDKYIIDNQENGVDYQRYIFKLATATGKTWILNAIIIWQYLNRYNTNFLIIAPNLIVKDRLVESLKGSNNKQSDIEKHINLFVPPEYQEKMLYFLKLEVKKDDEIQNINDEFILITNWHKFMDKEKGIKNQDKYQKSLENFMAPNKTNSLDILDKVKIDYFEKLKEFNSLVVFNDEAHHIHGEDVVWQETMNKFKEMFQDKFIQFDFSATPYVEKSNKRIYFNSIIVDFDLKDALSNGLTKLIVLDKIDNHYKKNKFTKDDYTANIKHIRENGKNVKIVTLSESQRLLLKLAKDRLDNLKQHLSKKPKMMVVVEDTSVISSVEKYLESLGYENKILTIHSNRELLKEDEYNKRKDDLFNLDNKDNIEVVISVLMLREGFDVNNIAVIVPLRATESTILLEQTVGRGLRLMYRQYEDMSINESYEKRRTRYKTITQHKTNEKYYEEDVLHIIEHPRFNEFYQELIDCGEVAGGVPPPPPPETEESKLKDNYEIYDIFFIEDNNLPVFIDLSDVKTDGIELDISDSALFPPYNKKLDELIKKKDEFIKLNLIEMTSDIKLNQEEQKHQKYKKFRNFDAVLGEIFNNIQKEFDGYLFLFENQTLNRKVRRFITNKIEDYIVEKMFSQTFIPEDNDGYNIFAILEYGLIDFVKNIFVISIKQSLLKEKHLNITKTYFSSIDKFKVLKDYNLKLTKTIYTKTPYPSNRGGLEKKFMEKLDKDANVQSFLKIMEFKHRFATIKYFNESGFVTSYYPDFIVRASDTIYLVETKADKDIINPLVMTKQKASESYIARINNLPLEDRDNRKWEYVLLKESAVKDKDTFQEMLFYNKG